ncbi:sigma-54-dependent transcriptional regulator [Congregibacter litoralis]|uniref:Response regulator n=1 Tax=Congregibacter litoralis KT71 TaxID=314285 RepID=A4A5Z8_9GAMM|nr:sigma-54 dependent transcriptional regulator [Congregibacter litoralis]EAQ98445.1 Response regulator [Congregibacter litoralis KT71]
MNQATRVLIVEDDDTLRDALCDTIEFGGYSAVAAGNGREALSRMDAESFDMVISDVQMDELDGHGLLREVRSRKPEMPFVMITAHGSVRDAVSAMRDGATDYLLKPFEAQVLLDMVARMQPPAEADLPFIAVDPASQQLSVLAKRIAPSDATVLVSGESGCGKEVLARYIHSESARASRPFLAVNCAAIPENMLESMLFGYEKGAYTGAYQSRPGKFEQANGGTLLLDEISEMDLGLQAKLLRVLQEREVERLGGNKLIPLDVRVIATTNRLLEEEVRDGHFREDLYYRLNVLPLNLPPLRQRPGDILPLARLFLDRYAPKPGASFDASAEKALEQYSWRGNVRELENCVQRAVILARSDVLSEADLLLGDQLCASAEPLSPVPAGRPALEGDLKIREQELILQALESTGGNRKDTAERLGISPRTLRYKLARLREQGISLPASA